MENALANPRRTKLDAWPEWRPAEPDSGLPAETDASEDELAAH